MVGDRVSTNIHLVGQVLRPFNQIISRVPDYPGNEFLITLVTSLETQSLEPFGLKKLVIVPFNYVAY